MNITQDAFARHGEMAALTKTLKFAASIGVRFPRGKKAPARPRQPKRRRPT